MFGLRKKGVTVTLDQLARVAGWIGWGTYSGASVSVQSSLDVPAVFCAARVIAEGIAQMPVRVMSVEIDQATDLERRRVSRDHWAHRLLAVHPNGWQTSYEFREGMVFCAALAGSAIAIKNEIGGEVRELLPVPPGSWSVEQLRDFSLRIRVDYADKTHGYFDASQVLYLRGPSLDGYQGLPAVRQAREAIGLSKALEKQQAKLAGAGGKPSGVLSFVQKLAPETAEKLRETWQAKFGPDGDGGIAILDGDAKFQPMTMSGVDAETMDSRRFQIEEIGRAMRVMPIMMMQSDKAATFASAEQMFRNHVIHTLGPWMERFEQACARDILDHAPGLLVDLDERNMMRGDFKDQAENHAKALGSGGAPAWMTQNEVRAELGMNPIDDPLADTLSRGSMNKTPAQEGSASGTQAPVA
ncbi:phage portal protein [Roseobacter sp. TSBP12]|uniref:phage portal protein n=1 Tax=Roseobacter sp. TSBP12 TaxID=1236613 RepID=UPI00125F14EC|nr:phage portal protein [Roseobacter sp. TSBP12]KAB6714321.1 phage portal protein [Roseobacter sp. TSBP12]